MQKIVAGSITVLVALTLASCASEPIASDEARVPSSSDAYSGDQYRDVAKELKKAGFSDIELKPLGDLITGWLKKPGTVKDVRIGGSSSFDEGDTFKKKSTVTIEYHSLPTDDGTATAAPTNPADSDASTVLNAENNGEFSALLALADPNDPSVAKFARKYAGRTVEFDANIASVQPHGSTTTLKDVLVLAGDYSTTTAAGPDFQLDAVSQYDLPNGGAIGTAVTVTGVVESYNDANGLFTLRATSVRSR